MCHKRPWSCHPAICGCWQSDIVDELVEKPGTRWCENLNKINDNEEKKIYQYDPCDHIAVGELSFNIVYNRLKHSER